MAAAQRPRHQSAPAMHRLPSLRADDVAVAEQTPRGVVALKQYLAFAERGVNQPTRGVPPVVTTLRWRRRSRGALRARGWVVKTQIGSGRLLSIDLAIVDPERPGRFLVGVECDGANLSFVADGARPGPPAPEVLGESRLADARVWSTDWFKDRERALARLLTGIDEAKAGVRPAPPVARVMRRPVRRASRAEEDVATYDRAARSRARGPKRGSAYVRRELRQRGWDLNDTAVGGAGPHRHRSRARVHPHRRGGPACCAGRSARA
jgi:hypothetical protein